MKRFPPVYVAISAVTLLSRLSPWCGDRGRFEGRPRVLQSKGLSHLSEHTISWAHRWISAWVTDLRREDQQRQRTALSPRRAAAMREEDRFVSAGRLRKFLKRADCGDRQNTGHDS